MTKRKPAKPLSNPDPRDIVILLDDIEQRGLHLCGEAYRFHDELTLSDLQRHAAWLRRSRLAEDKVISKERAAEDKIVAKERADEDAYVAALREAMRQRPR